MKKEEAIQYALESFSKPEVHYQVLLASTPDVAMDIVEMLPGVKELVELGPEAADAALSLMQTDGKIPSENRATIGLYLLHHIKTPETTRYLAQAVSTGQYKGINRELAASAFLRSAGYDVPDEDIVPFATDKAKEYQAHITDGSHFSDQK